MHELEVIFTITGGLTAALIFGYVTQRLGLSPIVGYLLAGIAVGPNTPGFVANRAMAEQFAEMGVILLMFGVGLQFHFKELLAVRRVAVPGAVCQSAAATLLGCLLAGWLGWSWPAGIVFGLAISVASTVVLLRVLVDNNELHTRTGHIAVGWLVVEDLFTVLLLVLLPMVFTSGASGVGLPLALGLTLLKVGFLVVVTFYAGGRLLPWLLEKIAATHSRELFTLTVLVIALGIAIGSAKLFGVSMALGAFLAGMVVRQSEFSLRAASEALPMRDAFAVLFFVSVGMLFHPSDLLESPVLILSTLGIIMIGKPLAALLIVLVMRYPPRVALSVAVALAQVGEFSFILATVGRNLGILGQGGSNALVAAAIVSISLNPMLYRLIGPFTIRAKRTRLWQMLEGRAKPSAGIDSVAVKQWRGYQDRVVVVGYGPTGRTVARLLSENGIEPVIIDLNLDAVRQVRAEGFPAVYGDASQKEILMGAGVADAVAVILTSAGMGDIEEVIRVVREINPKIGVVTRGTYLRDISVLRDAGADAVFSGEGEVALSMTEHILAQLGATSEQIDRERDRIRNEFGASIEVSLFPSGSNGHKGGNEYGRKG